MQPEEERRGSVLEKLGLALVAFLVCFPLLMALVMLAARKDKTRVACTVAGAVLIAAASIVCACVFIPQGSQKFALSARASELVSVVTLVVDVVLGFYVVAKGARHGKWLVVVLALVQTLLVVWFELFRAPHIEVANAFYADNLSVIMALVIGVVGSGIAVYALGYMRDHHDGRHPDVPDRRPVFFSLTFAFLGAMFAIVFTNNLVWLFCAWEATTVCSFALIGYDRSDVAVRNSFRQILLNLVGGLAFALALVWLSSTYKVVELDQFVSLTVELLSNSASYSVVAYVPLVLFSIAAFTKAAQFPFHSWLLGAMVAPTPTSALLHSSTMVKAGVFLLVKLAPCFGYSIPGYLVMLVGISTFLFASLAAISQSNAKRVLAYSTIGNLGLIVACAGVGTSGAVWAAIFLLVFHAVAKSLLFLCVGTAEHHIGSRDIEDMDELFERMPRLARFMAIGIMGMFIAPFGMLVSKWAAMQSFADSSNVLLLLMLAFGSAATFMFWAKWLGKVLAVAHSGAQDLEDGVHSSEWAALSLMCILTVGCCIAFPLLSQAVVVPYLEGIYKTAAADISTGDLWIMSVIALVVASVFLGFSGKTKKKVVPVYLAGAGVDASARSFAGPFGAPVAATQRNWYMDGLFPEKKVAAAGSIVALVLLLGSVGFVGQMAAGSKSIVEEYGTERSAYADTAWADSGVSFSVFDQYYQQYSAYYEQSPEQWAAEGISSMSEFMDFVYQQLYAQMQGSSTYSSGSSNADVDADAEGGE